MKQTQIMTMKSKHDSSAPDVIEPKYGITSIVNNDEPKKSDFELNLHATRGKFFSLLNYKPEYT